MQVRVFSTLPVRQRQDRHAFSRLDLLAVIAVLAVFVVMVVKSSAGGTLQNHAAVCLNNLRRLSMAWQLYAEDNSGRLVGNLDGGNVQTEANSNRTWVVGWLNYAGGVPAGADTNTLYLTQLSPLAPYANHSAEIFKCPSDDSLSGGITGEVRVRSYSMNGYLGRTFGWTTGFRTFNALADLSFLSPSQAFVFIDERPDGINDGCFFVQMQGYDPIDPSALVMVDFPSLHHDRGAPIVFADGHGELQRWRDPRTTLPERFGVDLPLVQPMPGNPDIQWLQARSSRRINSR